MDQEEEWQKQCKIIKDTKETKGFKQNKGVKRMKWINKVVGNKRMKGSNEDPWSGMGKYWGFKQNKGAKGARRKDTLGNGYKWGIQGYMSKLLKIFWEIKGLMYAMRRHDISYCRGVIRG